MKRRLMIAGAAGALTALLALLVLYGNGGCETGHSPAIGNVVVIGGC